MNAKHTPGLPWVEFKPNAPLDVAARLKEDYKLHRYQTCHLGATTIERLVSDRAKLVEALRHEFKAGTCSRVDEVESLLRELGELE